MSQHTITFFGDPRKAEKAVVQIDTKQGLRFLTPHWHTSPKTEFLTYRKISTA